jgi:hypothetical protein
MDRTTPEDAARALSQIEQIGERSSRAYGYEVFSRYFILWGVVWIAGQGASLAWPAEAIYVWWGLVAAGVALTCILPRRPRRANWRVPIVVLIALGFVVGVRVMLGPTGPALSSVLLPLVTAAIYIGMGLWLGVRFSIAGLALAACILVGVLFGGEAFRMWIGFICGGTLILAGLWLRRI